MANKKNFAEMTQEEIDALTGADKGAYTKWKKQQEQGGDESGDESGDELNEFDEATEVARKYYEAHPNCPHDSLVVCSDGTVFYNTPHGKNAADNYVATAKEVTFKIIER